MIHFLLHLDWTFFCSINAISVKLDGPDGALRSHQ